MAEGRKRIMYLDYLRIMAAFCVILIHVSAKPLLTFSGLNSGWVSLAVYDAIGQCAVIIFFMISGVLFLDKKKKIDIKSFYTRYIPPLVISFVVWSLVYSFVNGNYQKGLYTFAKAFIKGEYHMWYIPRLVGVYMIVPLLKKIVESKTLTRYFLVLFAIFTVGIPTVKSLLETFPFRGSASVLKLLSDAVSSVSLNMVVGYGGFMVLGHFLHTVSIKKQTAGVIYFLGVLGLFFTIGSTLYLSERDNMLCAVFMDRKAIGVCLWAVSVFVLFKQRFKNKTCGEKLQKRVVLVSDCTYGVYLIHPLSIVAFSNFLGIDGTFIHPVLGVPLVCVGVFVLSLAVTFVLKQIPFVKKYIV